MRYGKTHRFSGIRRRGTAAPGGGTGPGLGGVSPPSSGGPPAAAGGPVHELRRPFCQTGMVYEGGTFGCPLHNLIPEWNDMVFSGKLGPCPQPPAEGQQLPGIHRPGVSGPLRGRLHLRHLWGPGHRPGQRAEHHRGGLCRRTDAAPPARPAVREEGVRGGLRPGGPGGGGPAEPPGHLVTVVERAEFPGGLLMYGIPNMKLPKSVSGGGSA